MDGLLIDSEPLWRRAEVEILTALGVPLTESMCHQTMGLRIDDAVRYWQERHPWSGETIDAIADRIVDRVGGLVTAEGVAMPGAAQALQAGQSLRIPMALVTSSPARLAHVTLARLGFTEAFDVVLSAEMETYGKPHPAVYLSAARRFDVPTTRCVAFEDSVSGVISAKAARMYCVAVPPAESRKDPSYGVADVVLQGLTQISAGWLRTLLR